MDALPATAFEFLPGPRRDLLLLCCHASRALPPQYQQLGLDEAQLARHIGWDPGAAAVTRRLAQRFAAPAFFGGYSRLLVDLNRAEDHPELILARSDDVFVPANEQLDQAERDARLQHYHRPYHQAIAAWLQAAQARGDRPWLLAIHSFEPALAGRPRPWPIGVLWKLERAPVVGLINALSAAGTISVGDNQPYDGRVALGHTLERHAIGNGLPHALIELRNDLIASPSGQAEWADRIGSAVLDCALIAAD